MWTTEWNIKDNGKDLNEDESTADDIAMVEIVNQSFAHGMVLMEWWLKNLKINFNPNYADNFSRIQQFKIIRKRDMQQQCFWMLIAEILEIMV